MWRWPKAEAMGPIGLLIALPYLGYVLFRLARQYKLELGKHAAFQSGDEVLSGPIVGLQGDRCTIRTTRGDIAINRYDILTMVADPRPHQS
jgi:hypothetical protein